jgi:hypothetical protein
MEIYRIVLVGITAALGFLALGLGGFILSSSTSSGRSATRQERTRERQPEVQDKA